MSAAWILALQQEQRRRQLVLKLSVDVTPSRCPGHIDAEGQSQGSGRGQEQNSRDDRSNCPAAAAGSPFLSTSQWRARAMLQRRQPTAMFLSGHYRHQPTWLLPGPHPAGRRWSKARLWGTAAAALGQVRNWGKDSTAGSSVEGPPRGLGPGPPPAGTCPPLHANYPTCTPVTDSGPSQPSPPYSTCSTACGMVAHLESGVVGCGADSVGHSDGFARQGVAPVRPAPSSEGAEQKGIDAAGWRDFCLRRAALCTKMAELDQMLNTARPIMGRDGVARGSGSITPLLPAVKVLEADLMQSIWARSIWDLLQDVEEYIYFVCAQKDTQARHENLKQFGAEMQLHVASAKAQAELDAQGIATYFARDPYMKLASQMLQHDTVRARRLVPHLERCFARRPLDLEETTAAGGSGGDGGVGVQQPARGWLQFGERWQQLLAVADKADDQAEEVARMAVYGFLLLVAQQQGRFVADVDPLECAGVYFCYHFAEHVLGAFPDTRRLFTAMRVGFIPHVGWYNNLADSMPRRGSSRFGFRNLVNITFRAFFQPLAVDAWAKWARALAGGVEEIVGSAVEMVRAAELYYVLQRTGGEKDPYLERQLEFGLVVEQICAFAATQAYTTSVGVVDRSRDDYDDVDHADQPPLPLLALDLVDSLFNVANLLCSAPWRENTGGGGSAGTIPDVDFGLLPPMLDLELDSPEQALVLLLWAWRKLSETEGVFVCQPAVLMNAPVAAAADAACLESPQRVELLASVHWETLPRRGDVGYKWGWIKERIPLITATSNLGSHVKMILDALLKKRLMLMWIQCKGVIGLRRMLLALSQARREMLDAGRDFCLRCSTVLSWGDDESGGDEDGDATGERDGDGDHGGSDGGPSRCHNHPPHPHGRKSKAAKGRCGLTAAQQAAQDVMMQLDTRLRVHIGKLKLEPAQGRLDDRRQHHPSLNIYQEAYRLTEQFLGMVMAGVPEGVPAIRDGILLEFMMLECPPEQPWEAIRPAVPEHVRHQQEKQRNLQRKSELLREGA